MKCPTCSKPIEWKDNPFRPFCSERCQLIDLGRWVEGDYRVPEKRYRMSTQNEVLQIARLSMKTNPCEIQMVV